MTTENTSQDAGTNKKALKAEAEELKDPREFTYRGVKYTVEGDAEEWDMDVMLAFEDNKSIGVIESLLGAKQWAQFRRTKPKNKDVAEFSNLLFEAMGTSEGE